MMLHAEACPFCSVFRAIEAGHDKLVGLVAVKQGQIPVMAVQIGRVFALLDLPLIHLILVQGAVHGGDPHQIAVKQVSQLSEMAACIAAADDQTGKTAGNQTGETAADTGGTPGTRYPADA